MKLVSNVINNLIKLSERKPGDAFSANGAAFIVLPPAAPAKNPTKGNKSLVEVLQLGDSVARKRFSADTMVTPLEATVSLSEPLRTAAGTVVPTKVRAHAVPAPVLAAVRPSANKSLHSKQLALLESFPKSGVETVNQLKLFAATESSKHQLLYKRYRTLRDAGYIVKEGGMWKRSKLGDEAIKKPAE